MTGELVQGFVLEERPLCQEEPRRGYGLSKGVAMVGASGVRGQPGRCTGKGKRPANAGGLRGLGEHLDPGLGEPGAGGNLLFLHSFTH